MYHNYVGLRIDQVTVEVPADGSSVTVSCTTDLELTSLEWLYNGNPIAATAGSKELSLTLPLPDDDYTSKTFVCRATNAFGTQEEYLSVTYGKSLVNY